MSSGDATQIAVAVVLTLTLAAILWYASEARKQAKASVEMAREMREQRLVEERPYLLLDVAVATERTWAFPQGSTGDDINQMYPTAVWCRIHNTGPAPAKELAVTLLHPYMGFEIARKGYLLVNESWDPEPLVKAVPLGAAPDPVGDQYDAALVVGYRDIRGLPWATYLILGLDVNTDMSFDIKDPRHFTKRDMELHGQRRIPLNADFAL
jgi:hypothetical protein